MLNYQKLLDKLPTLIYVNDESGIKVDFYNQAWYDYTGMSKTDVEAGWSHIVHPNDLHRVVEEITKASKQGKPYEITLRLLHKPTGSYKWFLSICTPILDDNGKTEAWIGTSLDINRAKISHKDMEKVFDQNIESRLTRIKELEEELKINKIKSK